MVERDIDTLPTGTRVRELRVIEVIGGGGFGVTYLAEHEGLGRKYALKEHFPRVFASREGTTVRPHSHSQPDFDWSRRQFLAEARTLARFKHPNIVHVSNIFEDNNTAYMVLDYVDAPTMKAWLGHLGRPPSQAELDQIADRLLSALEQLHANDTLHRDIAPDNILIEKNGAPVLIDFGSARMAIGGRTKTLTAVIKEGFSPFEQYATEGAGQKATVDIYALAATLYRAVAGKAPPESIRRVEHDTCVSAVEAAQGDYRRSFLEAIDAGLAVFAKDRPQSVREWRRMLLESGLEPASRQDSAESRQPAPGEGSPPRSRTAMLAAALSVLALAGGGAYWIWGTGATLPSPPPKLPPPNTRTVPDARPASREQETRPRSQERELAPVPAPVRPQAPPGRDAAFDADALSDEAAWAEAQRRHTPAAYRAYLNRRGTTDYAIQARTRLDALTGWESPPPSRVQSTRPAPRLPPAVTLPPRAGDRPALAGDRAAWERARRQDTLGGYYEYLAAYPKGQFTREADERIAQLYRVLRRSETPATKAQRSDPAGERKAWDEARRQDTIGGYYEYLAAYPDGRHTAEADSRITALYRRLRR